MDINIVSASAAAARLRLEDEIIDGIDMHSALLLLAEHDREFILRWLAGGTLPVERQRVVKILRQLRKEMR